MGSSPLGNPPNDDRPSSEGEDRSLVVDSEAAGTRLDVWLHGQLSDLSRSQLQRYIREGRVQIDGACAKPSTILREGARIDVHLPPPASRIPLPEDIPLAIIYEDEHIIVLNKPSNLVVHPSEMGVSEGGTVVNALLGHTEVLSGEAGYLRPGIVHRLDRDTSGVLVVARHDVAHRHLGAQFRARTVYKEYLAFVHGTPAKARGEVDLPLGRSLVDRKKRAVRIDEEGKSSHTSWELVRRIGVCSWLRARPTTGRTHQIRLHLKHIGHPIVCDGLYGREREITRSEIFGKKPKDRERPLLQRHALHAATLRFQHPDNNAPVEFTAALPADLAQVWELRLGPAQE